MGYLIVTIVAVAVAVFTMQNTTRVSVRFAIWEAPDVPLAAVVLASFGVGILIAAIPLWFRLLAARSRVRKLSAARPLENPSPSDRPPPPDRLIEG
jgi:uncharacterized integral membrane protein